MRAPTVRCAESPADLANDELFSRGGAAEAFKFLILRAREGRRLVQRRWAAAPFRCLASPV